MQAAKIQGGLSEEETRQLKELLKGQSHAQLQQLGRSFGLKSSTAMALRRSLQSKALKEEVYKLLTKVSEATVGFTPDGLKKVDAGLRSLFNGNLPARVLANLQDTSEAKAEAVRERLRPSSTVRPAVAADEEPLEFFRPQREPSKKRKSLEKLKEGAEYPGKVVGLSLIDGLRVDIGAEADVLIPLSFRDPQVKRLQEKFALGEEVLVSITSIASEDQREVRRFPLLAELVGMKVPLQRGTSLQFRPNDDPIQLLSSRGESGSGPLPGPPAVDAFEKGAAEEWRERDEDGAWKLLQSFPSRPPPAEVISLSPDGQLQSIPVPELYRKKPPGVSRKAQEAWKGLASTELRCIREETRCLQKLAEDMATVETDLALQRTPTVPISLIGMTVLSCGQRCLLPRPLGDIIDFYLHESDSPEDFVTWQKREHEAHAASWNSKRFAERRKSYQRLKLYFTCKDMRHACATWAVEREELESRDSIEGTDLSEELVPLAEELEKIFKADPALNQESLSKRYLEQVK